MPLSESEEKQNGRIRKADENRNIQEMEEHI